MNKVVDSPLLNTAPVLVELHLNCNTRGKDAISSSEVTQSGVYIVKKPETDIITPRRALETGDIFEKRRKAPVS